MESSNFPLFSDGDVKVWIGHNVYQLHSEVLQYHSCLFRHALQHAPRHEGFVNFHLAPSKLSKVGIMTIQESDSPSPVFESLFDDPTKVREYWANILRILYRIKPNLHIPDLEPATVAYDLVDLGELIGSKAIVNEGVDLALRDLDQKLFLMVSRDPVGWLFFAGRIRSGIIYHEALIHLVGKWSQLTSEDQSRVALLPDYTINIVRESYKALHDTKTNTEALLSYMPDWMHLSADIYHSIDICMFKAASIFRLWLAHQMKNGNNLDNVDGGARIYRTIAADGEAYLGEDKFNYLRCPPPQGLAEERGIENRLNLIKDRVKQIVAPLLLNESRYDPQQLGQLSYLTCAKIDVDAIPWNEWALEDGINNFSEIVSLKSESSSQGSDASWVSSDNFMVSEPAELVGRFRRFRLTEVVHESIEFDEV